LPENGPTGGFFFDGKLTPLLLYDEMMKKKQAILDYLLL
jgi:hypothetical protein